MESSRKSSCSTNHFLPLDDGYIANCLGNKDSLVERKKNSRHLF